MLAIFVTAISARPVDQNDAVSFFATLFPTLDLDAKDLLSSRKIQGYASPDLHFFPPNLCTLDVKIFLILVVIVCGFADF